MIRIYPLQRKIEKVVGYACTFFSNEIVLDSFKKHHSSLYDNMIENTTKY